MQKTLLFLGGGALLVLIALYVGLTFFLGSIVKAGVNSFSLPFTVLPVQ